MTMTSSSNRWRSSEEALAACRKRSRVRAFRSCRDGCVGLSSCTAVLMSHRPVTPGGANPVASAVVQHPGAKPLASTRHPPPPWATRFVHLSPFWAGYKCSPGLGGAAAGATGSRSSPGIGPPGGAMFLSAVTGSQSQRTADDLLLDLGGAAVDGGDAAVEVGLGDRELHHVAVAAVELNALVDQLVLELGGVPL